MLKKFFFIIALGVIAISAAMYYGKDEIQKAINSFSAKVRPAPAPVFREKAEPAPEVKKEIEKPVVNIDTVLVPVKAEGLVFFVTGKEKTLYKAGAVVNQGESVETGPAGVIELSFGGNIQIRVKNDSLLKFESSSAGSKVKENTLSLLSGALLVKINEKNNSANLIIDTPLCSLVTSDACFKVILSGAEARIIVNSGEAAVTEEGNTNNSCKITAGKALSAKKGTAYYLREISNSEKIEMLEIGKPAGKTAKETPAKQTPVKTVRKSDSYAASSLSKRSSAVNTPPVTKKLDASKLNALKAWKNVLAEIQFTKMEASADPDKLISSYEKERAEQIQKDMAALIAGYREKKAKKYIKEAIKIGDEFLAKSGKYAKQETLKTMLFMQTEDAVSTGNYAGAKKYLKEISEKIIDGKSKTAALYGLACMEEVGGKNIKTALEQYQKIAEEDDYKFTTEAAKGRIEDLK
ncbi:MAG: hypothetical protein A2231_07970 [Candidatus Firestonebacteria bacterium RIFOXYA2_FULL_40_8]|nr:MAG: hypothetical protein A2231_07970 [Candidatus Firestonebacteria bacterium RIFOXYA2_FULL_40_8]